MAARRIRHEEPEEHENHERWLITYADMITLLMVLFIVLYSISQVDLAKFQKFREGLAEFGNGGSADSLIQLHEGGLLSEPQLAQLSQAEDALAEREARRAAIEAERSALTEARERIVADLEAVGLAGAARLRIETRGLVVTIVTDQVLFAPGSDRLTPEGRAIVDAISNALAPLPNQLSIEGHTDSVPISTARFPSNWELSTARATSVLRELVESHAIAPARLSAAGYADQRPVAGNDTAAGRAANRRVEIVVHSTVATEDQEA